MSLSSREVPTRVQDAFDALDRAEIPWLVLRGADAMHEPGGDIDVLVPAQQSSVLRRVLPGAGYEQVVAAGHAPHIFFLSWTGGQWVRLDAVTQLRWGRLALPGLGQEVLDRRTRDDQDLAHPHPEDAFWLLFMHCAADKRAADREPGSRFADARWDELVALAPLAATHGPVAQQVLALGLPAQEILTAARAGDRQAGQRYAALADDAVRARVRPLRAALTTQWHRVARRGGGRLAGPGLFVAVMGPDGSGKSTLVDALGRAPLPTRTLYGGLPRPDRVASVVHGLPLGYFAHQLAQTAARSARACWWRSRGRVVLTDRHALDSLAATDRDRLTAREHAKRALLRRLAVAPDLLLVLDAPAEVLHGRKAEHTLETTERLRTGFAGVARQHPRSVLVDVRENLCTVTTTATSSIWAAVRARQT